MKCVVSEITGHLLVFRMIVAENSGFQRNFAHYSSTELDHQWYDTVYNSFPVM